MLRYMERSTIHYLKKKGWTNVQIADFTGHHRDTIARVLKEAVDKNPQPRARESAISIYEIIAARYEKGAIIITSNKSLDSWGELVGDNALMMAVIDRLLHHGEVFYLRGSSYRLRGKEAVALAPAPSETPDSSSDQT